MIKKQMRTNYYLLNVFCALSLVLIISCREEGSKRNVISTLNNSGYVAFQDYDELKQCGIGRMRTTPFVLVKSSNDTITVIRTNHLNKVIVYIRKNWGWFNKDTIKDKVSNKEYRFFRYIVDDSVIEVECTINNEKLVHQRLLVKTREKCKVYRCLKTIKCICDERLNFDDINISLEHELINTRSTTESYYVAKKDNYFIVYSYPIGDTTIFSRMPGLDDTKRCYLGFSEYVLVDGAFMMTDNPAVCSVEEDSLAQCILEHSDKSLSVFIQNNILVLRLLISDDGKVSFIKLLRPLDDNYRKSIPKTVPIQFYPAKIAGLPVSSWYTIAIGTNKKWEQNGLQ